ncbi:MAG: lysophospholipid acyltransferase family protein [Planctomycetota bacterium]
MQAIVSRTGIAILYAISWLPMSVLYRASDVLAILLYDVFRIRRGVTLENLRAAFPFRSERENRRIGRRYYRHFSDLVFEVIKCLTISDAEIRRRCRIEDLEILDRNDADQRGVVAVLGHYGNWEWAALSSALSVKQPMVIVYKPLRNPYFDALFRKTRERFGVTMVPMREVGRHYVRSRNEHFVNCFVSDQAPRKSEVAHWTTFLNRDTAVHLGAEKLARKYDHAVVFVRLEKERRGQYVLRMESLVEQPTDTEDREITECHVRRLERQIREAPEFWLWSHRRWKRSRPVEREE